MRLIDARKLASLIRANDFTHARVARAAGCSRQFISALASGRKAGCSPEIATGIENALRVLPGTLFAPDEPEPTGRKTA